MNTQAGTKKRGDMDLPSPERLRPTKSIRTTSNNDSEQLGPLTRREMPLLPKPKKPLKPGRQSEKLKNSKVRGSSTQSPLQASPSTHQTIAPSTSTAQSASPPPPLSIQASSATPSAKGPVHSARFCGIWPPKPGPVPHPATPSWWSSVETEGESRNIWLRSYQVKLVKAATWFKVYSLTHVQFCKRCGDGGTSLPAVPCVRCASCALIYCVSESKSNKRPEFKGCIDVPAFALEWLCPICLKCCATKAVTDPKILKMATSDMNVNNCLLFYLKC